MDSRDVISDICSPVWFHRVKKGNIEAEKEQHSKRGYETRTEIGKMCT